MFIQSPQILRFYYICFIFSMYVLLFFLKPVSLISKHNAILPFNVLVYVS